MLDLIYIILATIIVAAIVVPLVNAFDKWKKEMDEEDENK